MGVLLALACVAVTSACQQNGSAENGDPDAVESTIPTRADASTGSHNDRNVPIVHLGDLKLQLPRELRGWAQPAPSGPEDLITFSICWPNFETYNVCDADQTRIRIDLLSSPENSKYPYDDKDKVLAMRVGRIF